MRDEVEAWIIPNAEPEVCSSMSLIIANPASGWLMYIALICSTCSADSLLSHFHFLTSSKPLVADWKERFQAL